LPRYLNLFDICLSTQSNDLAGQVRTTGKLPLYTACGRFVLSSQVGEAARVLPADMLVPYAGTKDEKYPERLGARIRALVERPESLDRRAELVAIARNHFDYNLLAAKVGCAIQEVLSNQPADCKEESRMSPGAFRQ
jgi:hypothetical protein